LWTAAAVVAVAIVQSTIPAPPPGAPVPVLALGGVDLVVRASTGMMVLGLLPVVPMTLVSAALMVVVSTLTRSARPGPATLAKYFPA
jgi:hypothetical protein